MKVCKICKEAKFKFQFYSIPMGYYIHRFEICKKCANGLRDNAVLNYDGAKRKEPNSLK